MWMQYRSSGIVSTSLKNIYLEGGSILKFSKFFFMIIVLFCFVFVTIAIADEEIIIAEEPIITTTCGQSPGALMVRQIALRQKLNCVQDDLLTADFLREKYEAGEGFRTLIITIGTSGKGLGAAGIDMIDEENRINAAIEEAKNQGILVIGVQIEGAPRRVDADDEKSMTIVAPQSDILVVHEAANKDNYYTILAEEKGIPLYIISKPLDFVEPLRKIFGLD